MASTVDIDHSRTKSDHSGTAEGLRRFLFVASVAFLCFVLGTAVMHFKWYPSRPLVRIYDYAAWNAWLAVTSRPKPFRLWEPARYSETGVTKLVEEKVEPGLTLFTSGHAQKAFLMTPEGEIAHEWHLPYREIAGHEELVGTPAADEWIYWRKTQVFPNGDLLAVVEAPKQTPWAYGLIKLSRDSDLKWAYLDLVHHDFDVLEDGRIVTLVYDVRNEPIAGFESFPAPVFEDFVVVLSPDGEEQKRVSLHGAIRNSEVPGLTALVNYRPSGDLLHPNAVEIVSEAVAERLPFAKAGQALISLRHISGLLLLDLDSEKVVWATLGPWRFQHDADLLENGNILLFDNEGHLGPGGRSRVLEFDPVSTEILWSYAGSSAAPFLSEIRSAQQRLPNGNTLITESDAGRIFEVTSDGEIVWEFINETVNTPVGRYTAVVSWAQRMPFNLLPFR